MAAKLINIILAFLVLISSTGFVVNKHYCQSAFENAALFQNVNSCSDSAKPPSCSSMKSSCGMDDNDGCCENEKEYFKLEQDQQIQYVEFKELNVPSALPLFIVRANIFENSSEQKLVHYLNYKPPLLVYDVPVLFQRFLC